MTKMGENRPQKGPKCQLKIPRTQMSAFFACIFIFLSINSLSTLYKKCAIIYDHFRCKSMLIRM